MVLAGAEPKAGRDGAGPEHDRDGGALLAEPTEQGDGDRLPVRPRDGGMATRGLAALARGGSGEHGGSIWLATRPAERPGETLWHPQATPPGFRGRGPAP